MTSLYLSNKPSQLNKDLIRYVGTNLKSIVSMGFSITFIVAHPDKAESYTKRGIINFPTLVHSGSQYVGVDKIKDFFNAFYQARKKQRESRTEKDDITDYWSNILAKGDEDEGGDDEGEAMKNKAQQAVQDRQEKISQRKPKPGSNKPPQAEPRRSGPPQMTQSTKKSPPPKMVGSSRKSNIDPGTVEVLKGMNDAGGEEAMDDKLMAKFFENQMETDV